MRKDEELGESGGLCGGLELVTGDQPILRTECQPFDFANPVRPPVELAESMGVVLLFKGGLGLSANQVGLATRVMVLAGRGGYFALFNPRVVSSSDETTVLDEGCLSFPDYFVRVKRPTYVRVRYQDETGETKTETFTGLTARVVQHELDHLDGVVFFERASKIHRERADRQRAALLRKKKRLTKRPKRDNIGFIPHIARV